MNNLPNKETEALLNFYMNFALSEREREKIQNKFMENNTNSKIEITGNSKLKNLDQVMTDAKDTVENISNENDSKNIEISDIVSDKIDSKPDSKKGISRNRKSKHEKNFICTYEGCGKGFDYKWILERHTNSHFPFKLFKCEVKNCNKAYKSKENLNLHFRNKHLGEKPYQCRFCSSRFSHRNGNFFINKLKKFFNVLF